MKVDVCRRRCRPDFTVSRRLAAAAAISRQEDAESKAASLRAMLALSMNVSHEEGVSTGLSAEVSRLETRAMSIIVSLSSTLLMFCARAFVADWPVLDAVIRSSALRPDVPKQCL